MVKIIAGEIVAGQAATASPRNHRLLTAISFAWRSMQMTTRGCASALSPRSRRPAAGQGRSAARHLQRQQGRRLAG